VLISCTWSVALFFSNKSATNVHVVHLEAFRDLGQSGGYAWGAAALVHMYDQLDEAFRTTTRQIGGKSRTTSSSFSTSPLISSSKIKKKYQ